MENIRELSTIKVADIVKKNDPHFSFGEIEIPLKKLVGSAKDFVTLSSLQQELPQPIVASIDSEASGIVRVLKVIRDNRDNTEWLAQHAKNHIDELLTRYNAIYEPLVNRVEQFKSRRVSRGEATTIIDQLRKDQQQVRQQTQAAADTIADIADVDLASYFNELASGPGLKYRGNIYNKLNAWVINKSSGYYGSARIWFVMTLLSIIATSLVAYYELGPVVINGNPELELLFAKALLLLGPAYGIRFSVRNYNAFKHLASLNHHKAVVLKTLLASQTREGFEASTRAAMTLEAARHVFDPGESGFITRRDGAGDSDNLMLDARPKL